MKPKVSVIVPVYNTEKYIRKCVDSIINQTLKDIEIILVDDGSTDNCPEILDEYSTKDNRVIVIHKENGGQGSARNIGLDIAKGEYIGFVDSDDWVELDMYDKLYERAREQKADICVCGRNIYSEEMNRLNSVNLEEKQIFLKDKGNSYILGGDFFSNTLGVTNKLYKKFLIEEIKTRFYSVSYVGSEDTVFNYSLLSRVNKIVTMNNNYYNSISRDGSTMRTYRKGYMQRTANLARVIRNDIDSQSAELRENVTPIIVLYFIQKNIQLIQTYSNNKFNDLVEELKQACEEAEFKNVLKALAFNRECSRNLSFRGFKITGKMYVRVFSILTYLDLYELAVRFIR